ncbi:hypothetical protein JKF63_01922 [Porcisia hertigi]|uniref:Uncharacterized protein n=1 Tax=Porcisia hertigi TaxID=2761500 RepID=A0A836I5U3_9TRYP|nr:hypothetical protein JKF63_01922 [Porcisia hertigi]
MSSEDESSWRLLFDIALSHGEMLRTRRLSHEGWMVFLSSAQLIGTATGVFPVLLEQLWQRQSLGVDAQEATADDHEPGDASVSSRVFSLDFASSRRSSTPKGLGNPQNVLAEQSDSSPLLSGETNGGEFVGFSAFVDMIKVICVRIFQTQRYMRLREGHGEHDGDEGGSALVALLQSAEDHVLLTESVEYTAGAFFRPFISRSIIYASSQMRLRPAQNGWALHVNRLVTHIVGVLLHPVILPLFRKYGKAGRLTEVGYRAFLQDNFPGLDAIEKACAGAIFHHGGFPDIRPLLKNIQPLEASASPEVAALVSHPTLGLTDFIEAMLMLAVVVYADEARYPAQRPITAKVWSFFEDRVCGRALYGTAMCPDPYVTGRYATVSPGLVSVYPAIVPRGQCPYLLVEVLNIQGADADNGRVSPITAQAYDGESQASPFLTEVAEISKGEPSSCFPEDRCANSDVALGVAAMFFMKEWSLLERNRSVPLFGSSGVVLNHAILMGGVVSEATPTSCPEILQVTLPDSLLRPILYGCAVEAVSATVASGPAKEEVLHIHFTPFRSLPVELAVAHDNAAPGDKDGKSVALSHPWGCVDVVVTETSLVQVISHSLLAPLHTLFLSQTPAPSDENPAASVSPLITLSAVCELCRLLQWCIPPSKRQLDLPPFCAQAWDKYCGFQRILHSTGSRQKSASTAEGAMSAGASTMAALPGQASLLSFTDFIGCLATMLFLKRGGGLSDVPDVPRALELALSFVQSPSTAGSDPPPSLGDGQPQAHDIRCIPHNAFRDVPFFMALDRHRMRLEQTQESRAALIASLREHHSLQIRSPATLPPLPENRSSAMRLVSQYGTVNPTEDFHAVMRKASEVVKAHFLQQEMAIPELSE